MGSEVPLPSLELIRFKWDYRDWATVKLLIGVESVDEAERWRPGAVPGGHGDGSLWDTVSHIIAADEHWMNRWTGNPRSVMRSGTDFAMTSDIRRASRATARRRIQWLRSLEAEALGETVHYVRGDDSEECDPLWQTLLHVASHGVHHRAEAWTALTAAGIAPPHGTDMIDWIRAGRPGAGGD